MTARLLPVRRPKPSARPDAAKIPAPPTTRALTARDLDAVIRIDAIHTGGTKTAYWRQIFRDFVGPGAGRGRVGRVGLVAERDGTVIGFLFGDIRAFEFGSEPCGWILEIGVDPQCLRHGVASMRLASQPFAPWSGATACRF